MNLKELQKHWHTFGVTDPMWAILTRPEMKGNNWDVEEFFETGRSDIGQALTAANRLGFPKEQKKALDFGCGLGRLTQALCDHFDEAVGVDIAPSMIEQAKTYNRHGDRCHYYLNETDDLSIFGDEDFDFIYTIIVLQHIEPIYIKAYLREFVRLLKPRGILTFQLPSEVSSTWLKQVKQTTISTTPSTAHRISRTFFDRLRNILGRSTPAAAQPESTSEFVPRMEMHGIPKDEVCAVLETQGATIVDVQDDGWAGPAWIGYTYYVTK